jgi:hypothetical protein
VVASPATESPQRHPAPQRDQGTAGAQDLPRPGDSTALSCQNFVVYEWQRSELVILVVRIGHLREVYR